MIIITKFFAVNLVSILFIIRPQRRFDVGNLGVAVIGANQDTLFQQFVNTKNLIISYSRHVFLHLWRALLLLLILYSINNRFNGFLFSKIRSYKHNFFLTLNYFKHGIFTKLCYFH